MSVDDELCTELLREGQDLVGVSEVSVGVVLFVGCFAEVVMHNDDDGLGEALDARSRRFEGVELVLGDLAPGLEGRVGDGGVESDDGRPVLAAEPRVGVIAERFAEVVLENVFHSTVAGCSEVAVVVSGDDEPGDLRIAERGEELLRGLKLLAIGEVCEVTGDDNEVHPCVDQLLNGGLEHTDLVFFLAL